MRGRARDDDEVQPDLGVDVPGELLDDLERQVFANGQRDPHPRVGISRRLGEGRGRHVPDHDRANFAIIVPPEEIAEVLGQAWVPGHAHARLDMRVARELLDQLAGERGVPPRAPTNAGIEVLSQAHEDVGGHRGIERYRSAHIRGHVFRESLEVLGRRLVIHRFAVWMGLLRNRGERQLLLGAAVTRTLTVAPSKGWFVVAADATASSSASPHHVLARSDPRALAFVT